MTFPQSAMTMKYNPKKLYRHVYRILDSTPIHADCGRLCGAACCRDSEHGTGMYLYPGENAVFTPAPFWALIEDSDFITSGKPVPFLTCPGHCERDIRPLACRVFPLVPYMNKSGEIKIIFDPRAAAFCPLRKTGVLASFYKDVRLAVNVLKKFPRVREFIRAQSELIDEYTEFAKRFKK